jgi:hypothetical protein
MRARGELGRMRVPSARIRADANLAQIWARDGSGRMRRSGCVAPLRRALAMRQSGRTRADAMRRPAGDALRAKTNPYAVADDGLGCRHLFEDVV